MAQRLLRMRQQRASTESPALEVGNRTGEPAPEHYEDWLRELWPATYVSALADCQHDFWRWLWACDPARSSSGVFVWPRGWSKTTNARRAPIRLATRGYRYGLYVQANQDMADDSVQNIGLMLENPRIARHYPDLSERKVGKHGDSKGWRRNRVWTRSGIVIDAAGLDTAVRGLNLEDVRPDFIVLDDIDGRHDSLATTRKKMETIKDSIIPAGAPNRAIMVMQNLIIPHGVVTRLANANPEYRADFLMDRYVSGPYPAIEGFEYEGRPDPETGRVRWFITAGESTWPDARPVRPTLEAELNDIGPDSFIREKQNDVASMTGSLYEGFDLDALLRPFPELDDLEDVHVWIDPAVTDTKSSDSNGIRAGGRLLTGQVIGLYSWEGRDGVDGTMRRALLKAVELRASTVGVETNQGGDTWATVFRATWDALVAEGLIPGDTPRPRFEQVKASSGTGGKRERWQLAKAARERGEYLEAVGTHEVLFRTLRRLPENKPYDLADVDEWLRQGLRARRKASAVPAPAPAAAIDLSLIGGQKRPTFRK